MTAYKGPKEKSAAFLHSYTHSYYEHRFKRELKQRLIWASR